MEYSSIGFSFRGSQSPLDGFDRFPWFGLAGARQREIVKIFPKVRVSLQVDENGGLFAVLVNEKLDAFH
jgi:hypothetical protein